MFKNMILCVSLIFLFSGWSRGENVSFEKISIEDGLSQSDITAMVQDETGFLWMATNNGLNRYDGYNFVTYKHAPDKEQSISGNVIFTLDAAREGQIWIGSKNGLDRYDPRTEKFFNYNELLEAVNPSSAPLRVNAICTPGEDLWIGMRNKIFRFNRGENKFEPHPVRDEVQNVRASFVLSVREGFYGNLYVATDKGLFLFNTGRPAFRLIYPVQGSDRPLLKINTFLVDKVRNQLIVGTDNGVYVLDAEGHLAEEISYDSQPITRVSCLLQDSRGDLWIGTKEKGLFRKNAVGIVNYRNDPRLMNSLANNEVLSLFEDRSGVLWVGTSSGGVNKLVLHQKPFTVIRHNPFTHAGLSDHVVRAVFVEDTATVWIGTKEGVLNKWDKKEDRYTYYKAETGDMTQRAATHRIFSIAPLDDGHLWVATGQGLLIFDKKAGTFQPFHADKGPFDNFVSTLFTDRDGVLWGGTNTGIFLIKDRKMIAGYSSGGRNGLLSNNNIRHIYQDRAGSMWIGTRDGGLNKLDSIDGKMTGKSFRNISGDAYSLSNDDVSCVFEDSRGRLWVGTWGGGINLVTDREKMTFRHFTEQEGLSDNVVFAIGEDTAGVLWISSYNGLSCFNPVTEQFHNYSWYDGLPSNEFSVGAYDFTETGTIYLGGVNGLVLFRPDEITADPYVPPVSITQLRIYNEPVRAGIPYDKRIILEKAIYATDQIKLLYNKRHFSFDFVAFSYVAPQRNRFAYMMEGVDKEWVNTGGRHSASYSNLEPGTYTFKVKGSNSDGIWNEEPVCLKITIVPPFWRTPYAYVFYFLVFCLMIFLVIRYYTRRAELRHVVLRERLEEHNRQELYHAKMKFYINISHELRTPLTLIVGLIENVKNKLGEGNQAEEQLEVMKKNADLLLRLINELLDFRKIESGNMKIEKQPREVVSFVRTICSFFEDQVMMKNIRLSFYSGQASYYMMMDADKVQKIVFNLLSNAVKFTHSYIEVGVKVIRKDDRDVILISVRDDGHGIRPEEQEKIFQRFYQSHDSGEMNAGSGIGLNLAQEMAQLHGGTLGVFSVPEQGATFELALPVEPVEHAVRENIRHISPEISEADEQTGLPILLIIDDNEDIRYYMRELLGRDYDIREAADGTQGLEMAKQLIPDIILSDVMMPDIDGIELCRQLKTDPSACHIPVILVTARACDESRIKGLECGADAYIIKPFTEAHIRALVTNVLKSREKVRGQLKLELMTRPQEMTIESSQDKLLARIVSFIEKNMADPEYDVDRLSKDVGLSRMHLYRKLKGIVGQTPSDFIRDFRLIRATDLLKQNALNISEVAYMAGFNNLKYFRICFKKKYGITPSDYVRKYRKE